MSTMKNTTSKQMKDFYNAVLKIKGTTPEWTKAEKIQIAKEARKAARHHI